MEKKPITNLDVLNEAPDYGSGFSRGIRVERGDTSEFYISGTASIDEKGISIHKGDFAKQVERTYYNLTKLLESEGATWHDVIKTTVYIKDINMNYDEFNKIRNDFFKEQGLAYPPASVGIEVTLCRPELMIEMDAFAIIEK